MKFLWNDYLTTFKAEYLKDKDKKTSPWVLLFVLPYNLFNLINVLKLRNYTAMQITLSITMVILSLFVLISANMHPFSMRKIDYLAPRSIDENRELIKKRYYFRILLHFLALFIPFAALALICREINVNMLFMLFAIVASAILPGCSAMNGVTPSDRVLDGFLYAVIIIANFILMAFVARILSGRFDSEDTIFLFIVTFIEVICLVIYMMRVPKVIERSILYKEVVIKNEH